MSWNIFGKGRTAGGAAQRDLAQCRDKQLANLLERMPTAQRKAPDNSLFEVQLAAPPDGRLVWLRIFLPTRFPEDRPVLQLLAQVQHPWVNQYMQVVGHPQLANWDGNAACAGTESQLIGNILSDVSAEFRSSNSGGGSGGAMNGSMAGSGGSGGSPGGGGGASPPRQGPPPGTGSAYGSPSYGAAPRGYGAFPVASSGYFAMQPAGNSGGNSAFSAQGGQSMSAAAVAASQRPSFYGNSAYQQPQSVSSSVAGVAAGGASAAVSMASASPTGSSPGPSGSSPGAAGSRRRSDDDEKRIRLPPLPSRFEELEGMTLPQLQRLAEDDVARRALLEALPATSGMREVRAELRRGNAQTAEATLARQAELAQRRIEVVALQARLRELRDEHAAAAAAHARRTGGDDDHEILRKVKAAAKAAEASSDQTANSFLGGTMPLPDFLEAFTKEMQRYHTLAAKVECAKQRINF